MNNLTITNEQIYNFRNSLIGDEHSVGTVEKYIRDIRRISMWLGSEELTKETAAMWKLSLQNENYSPTTINSMLAAINAFLVFSGLCQFKLKYLRIQKRMFRSNCRQLTKNEYNKLLCSAKLKGHERLCLLMETICSTGIRVSEIKYITVEAAKAGTAEISLKGKIRTIILTKKLCNKLIKYASKNHIKCGAIFITKNKTVISRKQVWAEMKTLKALSGVAGTKIFPHNLRHLFARTFYKNCRNMAKLANVLGHSSIETTRIYLISTCEEQIEELERLGLVN